nr:reverse transcriptase domain-containing protein [Tanacetum cinerariifolium]
FRASVSIKKSNDAVKLQALIDRKKVIITNDTIRQNLRLDNADGIACLPNEESFSELARMGYEKPAKRNVWNEFSSSMASAVICLAIEVDDLSSHNTKYTSPALTQKVFANIRRICMGFSGIETPLFDAMLVQQQVHDDVQVQEDKDDNEVCVAPTPPSPTPATTPPPPQQEPIPSPPQAQFVQPSSPPQQKPSQTTDISMTLLNTLLETYYQAQAKDQEVGDKEENQAFKVKEIKEGGIAELDADKDVTLVDVDDEVKMDTNIQGRMAESQAKAYNLDLQYSEKVLSMHDNVEAKPAEVKEVLEVVTPAKLMTKVVTTTAPITTTTQVPKTSAPRKRRGVVIQDPKETAATSVIVHTEKEEEEVTVQEKRQDPGKFLIPCDFSELEECLALADLGRPFLRIAYALVDVYEEELTLRVDNKKLTFNVESTSRYPQKHGDESINQIDIIDTTCEDHFHAVLNVEKLIHPLSGSPTPSDHVGRDILFLYKLLNDDPTKDLPPKELKNDETKTTKSSIEEPPEFELKDIPPHLEVNLKIHEVIKAEVIKLLDAGLIYPISNSPWVSLMHVIPKKGGMMVVTNDNNELILTRLVTKWCVCIDYQKLNDATRKDHFTPPFMDQMLERLAENEFYCFPDGFFGYFQIPINLPDQEKTTFTCPYGTFAYRRMPFALCNALRTFQMCMVAIFYDMIEKTMEFFMDYFWSLGIHSLLASPNKT